MGSDEPDRTFRLRIFEWDRSVEHTIGAELFSSGPFASPVGTVDFMVFDIGIGLTGGAEYAVIVDWGPDGGAGSGVAFIVGSPYGDGYANFSDDPFDETWTFDQNSGFDLAFRAEFVPAPGVLTLFGAVTLLSRRRRR